MLAMQYTLDREPELASLILCGSPASMIRWVSDCEELLAEETPETRRVIREHEASGFTACPEYQAAILGFYRKHVYRLDPWPAGFERSFAEAGSQVYNTMNGPSEFTVTGTLSAAATTNAPLVTWPRCTAASPDHAWRSSRTPRTCVLPSSRPPSTISSILFWPNEPDPSNRPAATARQGRTPPGTGLLSRPGPDRNGRCCAER
jgi:hypothetical protein